MAIEIISTLKPKNNGSFPIAEAKDIDVNGTRLDTKLEELANNSGGSGGSYVLELSAESGTLTDEQYNALVANAPNVVAKINLGVTYYLPLEVASDGLYSFTINAVEETVIATIACVVMEDKTYSVTVGEIDTSAGGSSSGGLSIKSITFTDRPTAYAWLSENFQKLLKATLASNQIPYPLNFTNYFASSYNGTNSFTFSSIIPEPYLTENRVVQASTYFSIWYDRARVAMNGVTIEFYDDQQPDITQSSLTEIHDAYWSSLAAQFTCYYIE